MAPLLASVLAASAAQGVASDAGAREIAPLSPGWRVELRKAGLALVGPDQATRAQVPLRGKHLDARAAGSGAGQALLLDADTQAVLRIAVDTAAGSLRVLPALQAQVGSVDALCLLRDRQSLLHAFVVGKEGLSEQWLLDGPQPRILRRISLPSGVKSCRTDDATQRLFLSEPGVGVWAYDVEGEAGVHRQPVALMRPWGPLTHKPMALAPWGAGLALLSDDGRRLQLWQPGPRAWRVASITAIDIPAADLLAMPDADGRPRLWAQDRESRRWRALKMPAAATPHAATARPELPAPAIVLPRAQTAPVARLGDAADDPAIWIHPTDGTRSRVLGTNKKQGLLVYDLQGRELQLLEAGRLNNVDLRQGVLLGGQRLDLAVTTRRDDNTLAIFSMDAQGEVSEIGRVPTDLDEVYGLCLHAPASGGLQVIVNDKDGRFQQISLQLNNGRYEGRVLRRFKLASQPEGCVVDERSGRLFMGEEKRGVWVTTIDAAHPAAPQMVLPVGPWLHADVEGMAIYHGEQHSYLIVSSQGDNSYVVLDAAPPYAVRGRFRIGIHAEAGIDGVSETDGLDVTSANLGAPFERGMLVVQDGYKRLPDQPQNFKYVAWDDIAKALKLR